MRGMRIFLALVALSVTVDARPDGYGVKGGRSYPATASAVANAHATANADGGSLGIAKSSASAIANANSNSGGTSNAFATASAYGGSIDETAASEKGNGYANEPGDSDDLRHSSDYGGDAEYKCINHEDGTDSWDSDAEHVASEDDYEDSKITEESYDDSDCGPGGVKGHGGTPGAVGQSRCKDRQSSASHQSPTQDKGFGLSTNSQHLTALGNSYEGKGSNSGTAEASHIEKPCAPGDSNCLMHKPSVANPYPTYDKSPDLSAGSSRPAPIDSGYGGNSKKLVTAGSSHATIPCSPGDPICFSNKPGILNKPYPTSEKNPHVLTGATNPVSTGGGVTLKPLIASGNHPGVQCAPGDSKCASHKPTGSNFFPTYDENPHALVDSQHTVGSVGGHLGQNQQPVLFGGVQAGGTCAPGDWKCSSPKPTGANPHPTHNDNPILSVGSQHPTAINSGHSEQRPGIASGTGNHPGVQCAPGDWKCSPHDSTGSNLYPAYDENPHALVGSQHTIGGIDGHIEQSQRPGIAGGTGNHPGVQCAPGDWECSSQKPGGANPHPTHNENPFLSVGSQHLPSIDSGHGEQNQHPAIASGTGNHPGVQCAPGDWKCSSQKPAGANPHPTHNENPFLSVGSQHLTGINSGHGEQNQYPGIVSGTGNHPGIQCAPGDWKCSSQKPTGANSHPTHNENPFLSIGSQHLTEINSGHGEHNQRPGTAGGTVNHAGIHCAPGDSKCSLPKPTVSNLHPTNNVNHHLPTDSQHTIGGSSGHGEQHQRPGPFGGVPAGISCAPGDWKCSSHKPSANLHHENPVSPDESQHPTVGNSAHVGQNAKPGTIGGSHAGSPCAYGDSICFPRKPSGSESHPVYNGNPATSGPASTYPTSFDTGYGGIPTREHPSSTPDSANQFPSSGHKPGASNPFLNGQIDVSAIKKLSNSDATSDKKIYSSNPFLSPDNQVKPSTSSVHPVNPVENHGSPGSPVPQHFPGHFAGNSNPSQEKPKPPNPFFSHHVTMPSTSGGKRPETTSGSQPNEQFPVGDHTVSNSSPNVGCYGSISCSSNKPAQHFPTPSTYPHGPSDSDSGHSEKIPNPANPFFTQYGHRAHSSGAKYPELANPGVHPQTESYPTFPTNNVPSNNCHGSVSCPANESSDGPSDNPLPTNHGSKFAASSTSLPGHVTTQPSHDSNPFSVNHQLTQPDSKAQSVPALGNPYPGHNAPLDGGKPEIIHGCGSGIPSVGCNNGHNGPMDEDIHSSVTEGHGIDTATNLNQYGVKGHRSMGVKGGHYHQGHPMKLLESPGLGESDHFGSGHETSAQSTAIASANANSNAYASSSSSSANGRSSASAKSQAYSSNGGDGSSNSWASSSASASASAFASSYSSSHSHHGWTAPEIPQVPAE